MPPDVEAEEDRPADERDQESGKGVVKDEWDFEGVHLPADMAPRDGSSILQAGSAERIVAIAHCDNNDPLL